MGGGNGDGGESDGGGAAEMLLRVRLTLKRVLE